jgi:arginyl-tRNA synthetase
MEQLRLKIQAFVKELYSTDEVVEFTRPDEQFGDFATNIAMKLAKNLGKNPREIAEEISVKIRDELTTELADVSVAGPGFLNLTLSDEALIKLLDENISQVYAGKQIVAEYSDPNPFKVLHAGHLYTSIVGDSIANLLEAAGGDVHRVNFGGDVGLHVGKTMWAILKFLGGENPEKLVEIEEAKRSEWMARCYIEGTNAYEDSEDAKAIIIELNKRVYQLHADNDHESDFAQIYWTCRQWSYDYFTKFYERIGTNFEKYYPESEVAELGLKTVREQLEKGVYQESDGAIIFDGEKYGLHTRVFINSEGLPTYEAKDVGLIMHKYNDYHFDKSVVITGNEQEQYMAVVLKSLEQFKPELVKATSHLTHGIVKLAGGVKMSSRKGNILKAVDVLDVASEANKNATGSDDQSVVIGAVKYAFLKVRTGGDIIYDPDESVSLLGNSGPYLQYAHARARSILSKAKLNEVALEELESDERSLVRKIGEYTDVVDKAVIDLMPHLVCTYLYELAQVFNRFYEKNRVIGDEREALRVQLVSLYADRLKEGLGLLGITAPDRM